ncbi:hypothetical protein AMJ44_04340 [candidate division WOR-1 bacterium DG_54_3]|uniref:Uncharacterized protein n=1 Tax=candidate division WOR-1 bacterium DG_54_3 TaxID=1703775 RepID=A0A0S7Y3C7_UNCSA|nr:MAG: hypothetical protein AMJ44_04340 [candidate division WOR-1 bacterium DG_54_3]
MDWIDPQFHRYEQEHRCQDDSGKGFHEHAEDREDQDEQEHNYEPVSKARQNHSGLLDRELKDPYGIELPAGQTANG